MGNEERISILTYNCHLFGESYLCRMLGLTHKDVLRCETIIQKIKALDPDIVCLQEIWFSKIYKMFVSQFKDSHNIYRPPGFSGLLFISKYAIVSTYFKRYNVSAFPDNIMSKGFGLVTIQKTPNDQLIDVFFTHAQAGNVNISIKNMNQMKSMIKLSKNPKLIVGDFNLYPPIVKVIFNTLILSGNQFTCCKKNSMFRKYECVRGNKDKKLDYVLYDSNLTKMLSLTGDKIKNVIFKDNDMDLSDHYPLYCELVISG